MNAGFLFQDRHWPLTEQLSELHDIITTKKSYVIHKNDIKITNCLMKEYKSVHTAYSYRDILATKKLSYDGKYRKTRSQESLPKHRQQPSGDVTDWLQEAYYRSKPYMWIEKLKRLGEKLNQPGGEKRLKKKIDRCVKKIPILLTDDMSEQILEKIKRLCSRNDTFRMPPEAKPCNMSGDSVDRATLKRHIVRWLKTLPIKKKDNVGRIIRREDILNSILYRLEPLVYSRSESFFDYQNTIQSHIMEIVYDMPIEHDNNKNGEYVKEATDRIVNELIDLKERTVPKIEVKNMPELEDKRTPNVEGRNVTDKRQPTEKEIKGFVTDEITYFLEGTNLTLSESRMIWIERELTDILMEALMHGFESDENLREDINTVLQDFGNFTEFQAEVFTRKLKKHFRSIFHVVRKTDPELSTFNYPKNVLVYYSTDDKRTAEKYFCANTKTYFVQLSKEIEEWLWKSNLDHTFQNETSKHFAITQLAENIINRHKYLERHPSRKRAEDDEAAFLTLQVKKWVRKFIGDKKEFEKNVLELTTILKTIPVPLLTTVQEISKLNTHRNAELLENNFGSYFKYAKKVYEAAYDWYQGLPNDLRYIDDKKSLKVFLRMLADNIHRSINENSSEEAKQIVAKEVDDWAKKVLKCSPKIFLVEELKRKITENLSYIEGDRSEMPVQTNSVTTSNTANNTNIGLEEISDYATYFKDVTREIDEWLTQILPNIKNNVSRRFAINDLATDIVDRQKYLKLNPSSYISEYEELETLKYQIFKWINKMIGENLLETLKYSSELQDRIQSIPIPKQSSTDMFNNEITYCRSKTLNVSTLKSTSEPVNIQNKYLNLNLFERTIIMDPSLENTDDTYGSESTTIETNKENRSLPSKKQVERYKINAIQVDCSIQCDSLNSCNDKTSILPIIIGSSEIPCQGSTTRSSFDEIKEIKKDSLKFSDSSFSEIKKIKKGCVKFSDKDLMGDINKFSTSSSYISIYKMKVGAKHGTLRDPEFLSMEEEYSVPHGLSLAETYEYFETIFKNRCDELPLEAATPGQNQLAKITRQGIYNGIWKTYFKLKSDPNVENDYTLFEAMLEDKLDAILDVLPQTSEMKMFRQRWKMKVLIDVTKMFEYVHSITEMASFRTLLANNFSKSFTRVINKELNDRLKHLFVTETVDAFILHSNYKNDILKSNIYKQRLMKKLEDLCENIKIEYPVEFGNVNVSQLCQEAFKILGNMALPEDEILNDESEEILLGDEVEQWYKDLPITINITVLDDILKNKLKDLLIKKLYKLEKRLESGDNSVEDEMRREIDKFLEKHVELAKKQSSSCVTCLTKHLNHMTNVLINRLKSRKQTCHNCCQQAGCKPINVVEPDPGSIMAPLINSKLQSKHSSPQQSICINQAVGNGYTNQMPPSRYTEQLVRQCGYTDQVAGSSRCNYQPVTQIPITNPADRQYNNVAGNNCITIVPEEQIQYSSCVNNVQRVFEGGTGAQVCNTAASQKPMNTRATATNTNAQVVNFEDIPCPCLEFHPKKRTCLFYGDGTHCIPINCRHSMYECS